MLQSCASFMMVLALGVLLAACSSGANPPPSSGNALVSQRSSLSDAEQAAVAAAAREMVGDAAAPVHGLSARVPPGQPGIHVCGYVKTPSNDSTALYVELREADGSIAAERGQVGSNPAALAKVRFMCRQHGDW